jgi:DNA repair protein RadC
MIPYIILQNPVVRIQSGFCIFGFPMNHEQPLTIKQWAEDDRPREKLLLKGRSSLSDAELLAILIATGTREESAVDIAKKVLANCSNQLAELGKQSVKDLKKTKGIGEAKAITILAALELGRRRKKEDPPAKQKISTSQQLYDLLQPLVADLPTEVFWVVLLNRANYIIGYQKISEGGVNATVVDAKIIFKYALENLASSIVLCHNHPSGSVEPSDADKTLTRNIKNACNLMQITLIDHIIIGDGQYYSFANKDML